MRAPESTISQSEATKLRDKLLNAPIAPDNLAPIINVGTDRVLSTLEEHYFRRQLADGISSFKYLEGDYGTGKTQFIQCLAKRAHQHGVATAIVSIGQECPFSSPLAIFRSVMSSMLAPPAPDESTSSDSGIAILFRSWIRAKLKQYGIGPGDSVPDAVRQEVERPFVEPWLGAPDSQMSAALVMLGRRLVNLACGGEWSPTDQDLVSWIRGDQVRSQNLKSMSLYEPASDTTAFQRLKTAIGFLRERMGYKGFFVAFDEGTRTMSFRRGSLKQRQAIENMLTMINQNAEGEFGGVLFLYAATPEFRTEVIQNQYIALRDRIGSTAFTPGMPMTPLIKLDDLNSDENLVHLGFKLIDVFSTADGTTRDRQIQEQNMRALITAERRVLAFPTSVPPRFFVFHWCRFLASSNNGGILTPEAAEAFVNANQLPDDDDE